MQNKQIALATIALMAAVAIALSSSGSAEYTATYNISDMTPIAVDLMGTGLVALKPNVTNVVDLGVLGLIISLMVGALIAMVAGIGTVYGKMKGKK